MNRTQTALVLGISVLLLGLTALVVAGCSSTGEKTAKDNQEEKVSSDQGEEAKGGAQLWAENCMRCHNSRPPTSYSDAQWEVAMQHMRVRANLTAVEHRKILAFLKSAN